MQSTLIELAERIQPFINEDNKGELADFVLDLFDEKKDIEN
jgi:hypothetical protein